MHTRFLHICDNVCTRNPLRILRTIGLRCQFLVLFAINNQLYLAVLRDAMLPMGSWSFAVFVVDLVVKGFVFPFVLFFFWWEGGFFFKGARLDQPLS